MDESLLYKELHHYFPFGFHLSRRVWQDLDVSGITKSLNLREGATEIYAVRLLAERFNDRYARRSQRIDYIYPGQLISVGILLDILRYLFGLYAFGDNAGSVDRGMEWVGRQRGREVADRPPPDFIRFFPPLSVMREARAEDYFLAGHSGVASNFETSISEMILLLLAMENPALKPFRELFNDAELRKKTPYQSCMEGLEQFFNREPVFGPLSMPIFECLRAPVKDSPNSLEGQIEYMRRHWAAFLPRELMEKLLLASDILKEENLLRGIGPGPNVALDIRRLYQDFGYPEPAAFSRDADWMSNVVILAKSVYVWLDQLSKKYGRQIRHLNDVPDQELDRLARWGFTGLWLIGLWERSIASQRIKQIMGNPEAASSAYSLYDYVIASDLGGEEAYQNLRERAWQRGIRLASDMVPNHMGVYSKWVIEQPDWFIQLPYTPFPVYQFNGEDLSQDDRIVLQIEDGYWDHRDAAVVFKRIDKLTGEVRYIYHGNDGTSMPWNDTAQLDFTKAEVREAVVQTILHVARKFPIIRFDAAMTLAKKHYQRLWFPQPGDGGAIPSRAEHGMSRADFDNVFSKEFWRDVVDRVAAEVPETLLIAEAFWLMEGYFVRTLGMHRVYNSAFMNMLKMEDNAKYRTTVKNVLEFSPEILKRFVNFMNNPDERTAVEQFGKGDKYYGVAVMMVTMPGLPMFGHGQIEGFTEKYGMEYRKAYWDESVDEEMVRRHELEIFPLMRRRRLFSGAANFAFFDFVTPDGWVDENVFAFSNRTGDERAVIIYNNAYSTIRGRIHTSTQVNTGDSDRPHMIRLSLAEALSIKNADDIFYRFRDHKTGLEYLRSGRQLAEEGLFAELHAYQYHAFLDFYEFHDDDGSWRTLSARLNGAGVPNIGEAYREMQLDPVLIPYREVLHYDMVENLRDKTNDLSNIEIKVGNFFRAVSSFAGVEFKTSDLIQSVVSRLKISRRGNLLSRLKIAKSEIITLTSILGNSFAADYLHCLYTWAVLENADKIFPLGDEKSATSGIVSRFDEWLLRKVTIQAFESYNGDHLAGEDTRLVEMVLKHSGLLENPAKAWKEILKDHIATEFLQFNRYEDVLWVNKEQYEKLIKFILVTRLVKFAAGEEKVSGAAVVIKTAKMMLESGRKAEYRAEKMEEYFLKNNKL